MTDKAFAQADPEWLALISAAREWLSGPIGQFLLDEERRMLEDELGRFFGGYLVHYGPSAQTPPSAPQVQRNVRLGAPLPGVEIVCVAQADVETALNVLREAGEQPWVIGQIATAAEGAAQVELQNIKAH